jgi:peptidoglycan/LPS O-acetylase OafA/YrhL
MLQSLYSSLLRLLPASLRAEFADEMEQVFLEEVAEAARSGHTALVATCLRELRDLLGMAVFLAWTGFQKKGITMETKPHSTQGSYLPAAWPQALLAAAYFVLPSFLFTSYLLVYELATALDWSPKYYDWLRGFLLPAILIGVLLLGFAGWMRGFPRWSYPYVGSILAIAMFLITARLDYTGQLAFLLLPLMPLTLLLLVVVGRRWKPLQALYEGVRSDPSQLSLAFACVLPLAFVFNLEETTYEGAYETATGLILALGVLVYMRSANAWQRALALPLTLVVAWTTAMAFSGYEIRSHNWSWPGILPFMLIQGSVFLVMIGLPSLLMIRTRRGQLGTT